MRPEIQVLQACELPSPISGLFWPFTDGANHAVGSHTMSFSVIQSDEFLLTQEFLAMSSACNGPASRLRPAPCNGPVSSATNAATSLSSIAAA